MAGNFDGFTSLNTDTLLHEGITLRERLSRDNRAARRGMELTFGFNYCPQMMAFYEGSESAVAQLAVVDPSQALRPTLTAALTAFKGRPCN